VPARTVVIGCGNLLRGDDSVGPVLVRRLLSHPLPPGVEVVDAGTAGADVVLRMQGAHRVVLVDAATGGGEPGTLYRLRGEDVAGTPPAGGLDVHRFRWDHALALARLLLRDGHPEAVDVLLVEAAAFEPGAELTPAVSDAVDRLVRLLLQDLGDGP
jgi:hydrogenase maturation protease